MNITELSQFCTIYLVRHGETLWNQSRRIQGHKDSSLTEEGIKQAKDISQKLRNLKFDSIYSSDLLRAKRTAEIIAKEHRLIVKTSELLRERHFGGFEGKLFGEYQKELKTMLDKYYSLQKEERFKFKVHPEVESDEELITRNLTLIREIALANLQKKVLIVSHGGVMVTLLVALGYKPYDNFYQKSNRIENTAYIHLLSDGVDFIVKETCGIHLT